MELSKLTESMLLKYDAEQRDSKESESATKLNKFVIKSLSDAYTDGFQDAMNGNLKQDNRQIQMENVMEAMDQCNIVANRGHCHDWVKLYFNCRYEMYQLGYDSGLNKQNNGLNSHLQERMWQNG